MTHYADFAVYGRDGRLALLVEVKGRSGVSVDWVVQLRRNMLAHGLLPPAPFFLLVLADRFYLWRDDSQKSESASGEALRSPDVEADAAPALAPFVASVGLDLRALSGSSLELVVLSWLGTLTAARDSDTDHADWVRSSGLLDAVRGGRVDAEALIA